MNKKDVPLYVLHCLEPIATLKDNRVLIEKNDNILLTVKDADPKSNFMFQVVSYDYSNGESAFRVQYSPKSDREISANSQIVREGYLMEVFNNWISRIEEYNNVKSIFDDPILNAFQAEFYSYFNLKDESLDDIPFEVEQIIKLDYLLNRVETRLIEMSDDSNRVVIDSIILEIEYVRENLATRSQKWIAENVSKIYAQIAKLGSKFMKEIWVEGKKEVIIEIVKTAIVEGIKYLSQ
ncbi:hypothetical protein U9K52_09675 [Chryseobacterium sp. MHB01]|uniref:hypothetical protein n=1 Tax=Chryseobacterium sp. MHB01 TaxID=3109433 RepID=UPI002AFF7BB5|nr:hypothetical protein [Chryseobacterium sp. MHB01]MEA1849180.1 hypothetical protein [Chryseobacterium sp. MHB01]